MGHEWPIWRLYLEKGTDPKVIDATWWIEDVLDANEALDVWADVQEWRRPSYPQQVAPARVEPPRA